MIRQSFAAMTPAERRRVTAMYGSIAAMHLIGFFIFIAFVVPAHYKGLGIGVSVLAYTLGLRHAFDADHIAVIDNTTRKEMNEREGTGKPRPFCFGYFFSLGHSTVVVAMGVGIVVAEKVVFGQILNSNSPLQHFGTLFGTLVSAAFLFLIGSLNLVILAGIVKVFRAMRRGEYDEAELERQLDNRGFFYRFFGRWMRAINKEWQLYPVGFLFGLGFDTTTEVLLLSTLPARALHRRNVSDGHDRWHLHEPGLRLGVLQPGAQGLLQPRHHGPVGRDLLPGRRDRGTRPDCYRGQGTEDHHRLLGVHARFQYQRGRLRDRRAVHRHLDRRRADLALRPDRGEVDGTDPGRPGGHRGR
jgi:hypothetical protein